MNYTTYSMRLRDFVQEIYQYYAVNNCANNGQIQINTSMIRANFPMLTEPELADLACHLMMDKLVVKYDHQTITFSADFLKAGIGSDSSSFSK